MSDVSSGAGWAAARIVAVVLAVAALAVAVAAAAAPGAADGAEPSVRLTVTFVRGDGAARHVAHLRCTGARASADGYLRAVGPARACRHARRVARLLTTAPPRQACTQLYGGPERARVTGRIGARRVARSFSRTNGCQIADWARTVPLLPRPTAS